MKMNIKGLLWIGVTVLISACSHNPPQRTADFVRADSNGDGHVSLPEWLGFGGTEAAFLAIDRERAGKLDEAAFREALRMSDQGAGVTQRQRLAEDVARSVNGIGQVFNQIVIRQ